MIQLKKLFTPVSSMEAEEARAYLAQHPEGFFTLLDVRQPWEYEESHIPGARLIPLPQVHDSYKELDPNKPTLVYCAIGGRSRVAAQMLSGFDFREVYNLAGGIKAFQGQKATGPEELNLNLIRGDETPVEIIVLAYGMETALKVFYETLAEKTPDLKLKELFLKLARLEEHHQQRLSKLYQQSEPAGQDLATSVTSEIPQIMEGGFDLKTFMEKNAPLMEKASDVLELALMLETQALDLYLRFAHRSAQAPTRDLLFSIAAEEKTHLASLGRLLEESLGGGPGSFS
ncbi:MAG: rhodanese-like domain-containing protein [Desulfobaccales bacterium]|nr:rhodanese-like domain-containing protein [Desulfobaccales bacterium]